MRSRLVLPGPIRSALPWLALALVFANFVWFYLETQSIGGDGLNGYVRDGHYFVTSHGASREVPEGVWMWSRIHAASVLIGFPIGLLAMAFILLTRGFPLLMRGTGNLSDEIRASRVREIRGSGVRQAAGMGSRVGWLTFSNGWLVVSVYEAGLIVEPLYMREFAILATEVVRIAPRRGFLGESVAVVHQGVEIRSPVIVSTRDSEHLVEVLTRRWPDVHR